MLIVKKLIPMTLITVLTIKIVMALRRSFNKPGGGSRDHLSAKSLDRITVVIIVVSVTFIVLQLPSAIYPVLREFTHDDGMSGCVTYSYVSSTADFLALSNSAVNFWLYFMVSKDFRKKLFLVLRC